MEAKIVTINKIGHDWISAFCTINSSLIWKVQSLKSIEWGKILSAVDLFDIITLQYNLNRYNCYTILSIECDWYDRLSYLFIEIINKIDWIDQCAQLYRLKLRINWVDQPWQNRIDWIRFLRLCPWKIKVLGCVQYRIAATQIYDYWTCS